jgi:serine/threonine protein kinase
LVEECLLGSGEFAIVKKMIHKPTGNKFAVKHIRYTFSANDYTSFDHKSKKQKTSSELMDLEVLKRVGNGCSFLIRFYGALFVDSNILIVTEVMDTSIELFCLKAAKLKLKLPENFMALIGYSVLSALSYMKKLKLIHRDVKPSNILVNSNGEIKLCDFGISGITIDSICNSYKGCQRYMAVCSFFFYCSKYVVDILLFNVFIFVSISRKK